MQEQKVRAREARKALGDLGWAGVEFGKEIPATEFIGYTNMEDGRARSSPSSPTTSCRDAITAGQDAILVLDQTPFYAEMGGQVADQGVHFRGRREVCTCRMFRRTRAASSCITASSSPALSRSATPSTASIDSRPPQGHHARALGDAPACMTRCAYGAGRPRPSGRLVSLSRTACATTLRISRLSQPEELRANRAALSAS